MEYTDKTALQNYLLTNIDASFDDQITEWITAMSQYIDMVTARTFVPPTEDTEKLYDGNGTNCLLVDDFINDKPVVIIDGGDAIDDADYSLYPANSLPKTKIVLRSNIFTKGLQNISIEAEFGYGEEVPAPIKWATTVLVAGIINASNQSEGEVQQETIGRYSVTYKTEKQVNDFEEAKRIIELFRRPVF